MNAALRLLVADSPSSSREVVNIDSRRVSEAPVADCVAKVLLVTQAQYFQQSDDEVGVSSERKERLCRDIRVGWPFRR